jgi:excisionase family DNA binding protein
MGIYRLIDSGRLAAYRIARRAIRIDERALREFIANTTTASARGASPADGPQSARTG